MTFNSISFAVFLPIFIVIYYAIYSRSAIRDIVLLVGSYLFYMSWYWQYAGLIALSTLVDFFIGKQLAKESVAKKRKILVSISLIVNLGILGVFKYYNFFIESSRQTLGLLGLDIPIEYHQLLLPVGISFYTFQTLSYTLDIYRNKIPAEKSLTKFAVFVSFFPQLVAGPIVRAKDFLPQLNKPTIILSKEVEYGVRLIFLGLFKKIVIADLLAYLVVDEIFLHPGNFSSWDLLIGLYAYAFQIYCDFSGYSDIAIGIALILGFKLPINFNRPYISQNPSEFWLRWHISLSSWLRDYLYISLGGNRGGAWLTRRNLLLTMLLGGLWHGAAWNFVLWGAYQGAILIIFRSMVTETEYNVKAWLKVAFNFHLIVFGWLLFRVTSMDNFMDYISGLSALSLGTQVSSLAYLIIIFAAFWHFFPKKHADNIAGIYLENSALWFKSAAYVALMFIFVGASVGAPTFIYFQF
jgi:alginate O-acetyltransferase complex protein AlgI